MSPEVVAIQNDPSSAGEIPLILLLIKELASDRSNEKWTTSAVLGLSLNNPSEPVPIQILPSLSSQIPLITMLSESVSSERPIE
ncbi:MAG: hypothetical protein ACD_34C00516G0004 [uncultured bacterium]|nr:MAG: hypothetical protein ACD_34C00516G0004 [uncultured bacterium]